MWEADLGEAENIVLLVSVLWLSYTMKVLSGFRCLEIYKNLVLSLSTITFTVNSHADNHLCKYIYLFQILYCIKFILIYYSIFKFDLNVKLCFYFF